jgi:hypothetical protein
MGPSASPPRARVRICFLHGHSKSSIGLMASRCAPAGTKPGLRRDPHAVLARTAPPWQCPHGRHTVSQLQRPAPFTLAPSTLHPEVASPAGPDELAVVTFNFENLDPTDVDPEPTKAAFHRLANIIVTNVRSPDLIMLEEVQDNTGPTSGDGVVDASVTTSCSSTPSPQPADRLTW